MSLSCLLNSITLRQGSGRASDQNLSRVFLPVAPRLKSRRASCLRTDHNDSISNMEYKCRTSPQPTTMQIYMNTCHTTTTANTYKWHILTVCHTHIYGRSQDRTTDNTEPIIMKHNAQVILLPEAQGPPLPRSCPYVGISMRKVSGTILQGGPGHPPHVLMSATS